MPSGFVACGALERSETGEGNPFRQDAHLGFRIPDSCIRSDPLNCLTQESDHHSVLPASLDKCQVSSEGNCVQGGSAHTSLGLSLSRLMLRNEELLLYRQRSNTKPPVITGDISHSFSRVQELERPTVMDKTPGGK